MGPQQNPCKYQYLQGFLIKKLSKKLSKTELTCKIIKFDTKKNIFEYIGNVEFKNEIIQFEKAEKIVYNKETNEILVTGLNEFTIDGVIQVADNPKMKTLRYKIGERIVYIE